MPRPYAASFGLTRLYFTTERQRRPSKARSWTAKRRAFAKSSGLPAAPDRAQPLLDARMGQSLTFCMPRIRGTFRAPLMHWFKCTFAPLLALTLTLIWYPPSNAAEMMRAISFIPKNDSVLAMANIWVSELNAKLGSQLRVNYVGGPEVI